MTIDYRSGTPTGVWERQQWSVGTAGYTQTSWYDDMGRLATKKVEASGVMSNTTMWLDYTYDELGRVRTITHPDSPPTVVRYGYEGSYLTSLCEVPTTGDDCSHPDAVSYIDDVDYDGLGRRQTVHSPAGTQTFAYNPATHRLSSDGFVGNSPGGYARTLDYPVYDELGNVESIVATGSPDMIDLSASYSYDARSRLSSWTKAGNTAHYTYDELGNLTGQRVGTVGTTNQLFEGTKPHAISTDQYTNTAYTYDADGNLKTRSRPGEQHHFSFDSDNRMRCVGTTGSGAGVCDVFQADYTPSGERVRDWVFFDDGTNSWDTERFFADEVFVLSDRLGERVGRLRIMAFGQEFANKRIVPVELRLTSSVGGFQWTLPEGAGPALLALLSGMGLAGMGILGQRVRWAEVAVQRPAFATVAVVVSVGIILGPLPGAAGGGGVDVDIFYRWILSDHLGSANATLGADGIAERQTTFKPFGEVHQGDVGAGWGDAVFAGHPSQWVLGLVYMRARWQNPETGSFVSVDPVVADASAPESYNAYMYVENNPVGLIDPSGMIGMTSSTWINQNPGGMTEFVFTASRSGSRGGGGFSPASGGGGGPSFGYQAVFTGGNQSGGGGLWSVPSQQQSTASSASQGVPSETAELLADERFPATLNRAESKASNLVNARATDPDNLLAGVIPEKLFPTGAIITGRSLDGGSIEVGDHVLLGQQKHKQSVFEQMVGQISNRTVPISNARAVLVLIPSNRIGVDFGGIRSNLSGLGGATPVVVSFGRNRFVIQGNFGPMRIE